MAYTALATKEWCSDPVINAVLYYDRQRSGLDMKYKLKVVISALSSPHYFEYPIYLKLYLAGAQKASTTLKALGTRTWSQITYETGWLTVSNKTSGTVAASYNIYSGAGNSRDSTYSFSLAVDPALSALAADDGILGASQGLGVTQYDSGFRHSIRYSCGSTTGVIATKIPDTALPWTPPLSLANENTEGNKVSVKLTIETFSGNTSLGSKTKTITCTIPNTLGPTVAQVLTDTANLYDTFGAYVQGQSAINVALTISNAEGATTSRADTTLEARTYNGENITTDKISSYGAMTLSSVVTDSRGREVTVNKNISVLQYAPPVISNLTAKRCGNTGVLNPLGEYIKIAYAGSISSLNGQNSAAWMVRYKKITDASYTSVDLTSGQISTGYIVVAAEEGTYDVVLTIQDEITTTNRNVKADSINAFWSWCPQGQGIALGKVAELLNYLDLNWNMLLRGDLYIDRYGNDGRAIYLENDASRQGKTFAADGLYPHKVVISRESASGQNGFVVSDFLNNKCIVLYNDVNLKAASSVVWKRQSIYVTQPLQQQTITSAQTPVNLNYSSYIVNGNPGIELLSLSSNAVVCAVAGIVKLSAKVYLKSGFVDGDVVYIRIYINGTQISGFVHRMNGTGEQMITLSDEVLRVATGDAITIAAENRTGGRGVIGTTYNNYANYMYVEYIG